MKDVFKSSNTAGAGNVQYFQQHRDLYSNVHCEPSGHPCSHDTQARIVIGDILWCRGCFMTTGLLKDSTVPSNKAGLWCWSIISLKHQYVFVWATTHYFILNHSDFWERILLSEHQKEVHVTSLMLYNIRNLLHNEHSHITLYSWPVVSILSVTVRPYNRRFFIEFEFDIYGHPHTGTTLREFNQSSLQCSLWVHKKAEYNVFLLNTQWKTSSNPATLLVLAMTQMSSTFNSTEIFTVMSTVNQVATHVHKTSRHALSLATFFGVQDASWQQVCWRIPCFWNSTWCSASY